MNPSDAEVKWYFNNELIDPVQERVQITKQESHAELKSGWERFDIVKFIFIFKRSVLYMKGKVGPGKGRTQYISQTTDAINYSSCDSSSETLQYHLGPYMVSGSHKMLKIISDENFW